MKKKSQRKKPVKNAPTHAPAAEPMKFEYKPPEVAKPVDPPKPVQFTARQLSMVHNLLMDYHRLADEAKDEIGAKVIRGAFEAVHATMRDWWDALEKRGKNQSWVLTATVTPAQSEEVSK